MIIVPVLVVVAIFLAALVLAHHRSSPHPPVSGPMGRRMVNGDFLTGQKPRESQLVRNLRKYRDID